jgi:prepilin-type N-terminal cleavage/methylation domain-containing protein
MGQLGIWVEHDGSTVLPIARRNAAHRRGLGGFTLVELLAVILIVGMLAAILTPVVMQSLTKARNTAIKAEIDMLHMALMNYKNDHGSFPPCFLGTTNNVSDGHRVATRNHLRRLFPRANTALAGDVPSPTLAQLTNSQLNNLATPLTNNTPESLVFWLRGFTTNPASPLQPTSQRQKLFDFDESRAQSGSYYPSGKPNAPYRYLNSANYFTNPPSNTTPRTFLEFDERLSEDTNRNNVLDAGEDRNGNMRLDGEDVNQNGTLDAGEDVNGDGRLNHGLPFNADSFQIISAGRDEVQGTGDDVSNFWQGTRQEYLDSL